MQYYELSKIEKFVLIAAIGVCAFAGEPETNPQIKQAGISLIVGIVGAVVFAAAAAFAFLQKPPPQDGLEPQSLDSFGMTQCKEGTPVPLLYGLNRVAGNLLYYGNLETTEIYQKVKGGKGGGGSSKQLSGYEYRLDVWQSIGLTSPGGSRIEVTATYIDDELQTPEAGDTIYNDGTSASFPSFVPMGGKLPNVSHVGYDRLFLGENRTNLPVIHFVTKTYLATGLPNENVDNGNNPAAVIWDLLLISGSVKTSDLDVASFTAAANYWNSVGYACSLKISSIKEVFQVINQILQTFPGVMYPNAEGKLVLRAFDPTEAATATITNDDHKDLKFQRQTYIQMNNDFSAKYVDKDLAFTDRHVGASNDAVIELVGERKPANFDLSMMRTSATAARRIDEIMKNESYPKAIITFTTNLKFRDLQPGDVFSFSNTRLGISQAYFRATSVSRPSITESDVKIKAVQMTERLFDSNFVDTVESVPSGIGDPQPDLSILDVFEMPYNPISEFERVTFILAERLTGLETGFDIGYSPTRTPTPPATELEFTTVQRFLSYSMSADTQNIYNFTSIRDNVGYIDFMPNVTYYPEFDNEQLIASYSSNTRYAILKGTSQNDEEIITFATITPIGGGVFRMSGIQRGRFGTHIHETLSPGRPMILFNVSDNVLKESVGFANLSQIQGTALFADSPQSPPLDTFDTANDEHSIMPGIVAYFEVTKTGVNYDFKCYPTVNANAGFGRGTANSVVARSTRSLGNNDGKIRLYYNVDDTNFTDYTSADFSSTAPSSGVERVNLQFIETRNGKVVRSHLSWMYVGPTDGVYVFRSRSKWRRKLYDINGTWSPTAIQSDH